MYYLLATAKATFPQVEVKDLTLSSQNVRNGLEHTFLASHSDIIPEHSQR